MRHTKMKKGLFVGSFDPPTIGHYAAIVDILPLFDTLLIAIGVNSSKKTLFSLKQRLEWLNKMFSQYQNIEIVYFEGLTVDFCKKENINFIVRGLRNGTDFEYEKTIASVNESLTGIKTIFIPTRQEYNHVSSTIVRELIYNKADTSKFIHQSIKISENDILN